MENKSKEDKVKEARKLIAEMDQRFVDRLRSTYYDSKSLGGTASIYGTFEEYFAFELM